MCKRISSSRAQSRGCRALLQRGATADALCTHPTPFPAMIGPVLRHSQPKGRTSPNPTRNHWNLAALRHQRKAPPGIEILTVLQDFHDGVGRNLENKEHPTHPFVKKGNSRSGMLGLRSEVTCAQPRFVPTSSALANQTRERIGGEASAPPRRPMTIPSATP